MTTGLLAIQAQDVWAMLRETRALWPEIILLIAICTALVAPVLRPLRAACRASHGPMTWITLAGLVAALLAAVSMLAGRAGMSVPDHHVLSNVLVVDRFALTFKVILYAFSIFVVALWMTTTRKTVRPVDAPDFVSLLLSAVLGMSLMASAANLLMIFLAIESASFPSYALAGFRKTTRRGSEASLKYVLFGAASSAIMVYGLSILYAGYGTLDLVTIAQRLGESGMSVALLMGLFGLIVGIGFKLSAVPMHFWCPDVFEGASIEITTFLSVASKGAAVILLLRVMLTLGHFSPDTEAANRALVGISTFVGFVGLVTATWGNLTAYFQDNVKRLLAYSSIAHSGYMIMGASLITAAVPRAAGTPAADGLAYAILFYLFVYSFMNLGAFTIAAVIDDSTGSESLMDYAGLASRNPALALLLGAFLMSLFGMPVTGGFWGKVFLGVRMWEQNMWWLVLGLVINTVFSLYFYLKPIIIMVWLPAQGRKPATVTAGATFLLTIAALGVFATGIIPTQVTGWIQSNSALNHHLEPALTHAAPTNAATTASLAPSHDEVRP